MTRRRYFAFAFALSALSPAVAPAQPAAPFAPVVGQAGKDVVWVPTPQALVDRMLDMAKVGKDDYLIDLGSGDGRTVITAAKRGVRAHGIEYDPNMVTLSERNAKEQGVTGRATFERADIFKSDFSKATVVTLFLLPELNVRLRPILLDMKPGTRVVSNSFDMDDWKPDESIEAGGDCVSWCRAHKWIVPAKVGGNWRLGDGSLKLSQRYQMLTGALEQGGRSMPITDASMDGTRISFSVGGQQYVGDVKGSTMSGTVAGRAWNAARTS